CPHGDLPVLHQPISGSTLSLLSQLFGIRRRRYTRARPSARNLARDAASRALPPLAPGRLRSRSRLRLSSHCPPVPGIRRRMDIQRYLLTGALVVLAFMLKTEWGKFSQQHSAAAAATTVAPATPNVP